MLIPFSKIVDKYNMKIHGILHIGAHKCEELIEYNKYGIKNNDIIWVEANPKLVEENLNIDKTRIVKNFICCDTNEGKTKLNIANDSELSSILELGTYSKSYPSIKYNTFIEVDNCRIDKMYYEDKISKNFANFLNINIQGAELKALKGIGDLIYYFDYVYLKVNKDYVYKKCALIDEIDLYLSKYNYKRVETAWTNAHWGDALYIRIKDNFNFHVVKNIRYSEEIWQVREITLEDALEKAKLDPRVKVLHWYKKDGGHGLIDGVSGWYQGAGGSIETLANNDWDTIILKKSDDNNILTNLLNKIPNEVFYCKTNVKYPPFVNGLYLEEYFLNYIEKNEIITKKKYIPALWTNFQIRKDFKSIKNELQKDLDKWIENNPSNNGYFCVIQHDNGSMLNLPKNTIVYNSGNNGDFPLPLIYEDKNNILENISRKSFIDKKILCSFVGNITYNGVGENVRQIMFNKFKDNNSFVMINSGGWNENVNTNNQKIFIDTTISSKFAFAPRGYGRTSFRFFECFLLGTIPIYIWNDKLWLPFQDIIDYDKLCIVINISQINTLEEKLKNITENEYNAMWSYYKSIKHLFKLEGMTKQILSEIGVEIKHKFSLCIPTMNRYEKFLSIYLPKYINNSFIDEIIISDENGDDVKKIKQEIKNLDKFKFNINEKRLGAFNNKIKCCQLAKNEWIALIDSDNFVDIDYFFVANNFLNNNNLNSNTILAPSYAKPNFDLRNFSGICFKKGNFKNIPYPKEKTSLLMNTGNYIINKYLIDKLILTNQDKILIESSNACDVILFNTLLFEYLDLEMYVLDNLHYKHIVHNGSTYLNFCNNTRKTINITHERYYKLFSLG